MINDDFLRESTAKSLYSAQSMWKSNRKEITIFAEKSTFFFRQINIFTKEVLIVDFTEIF